MVMGPRVETIAESAVDTYAAELEREQLRKARLATVEKWKEVYALLFASAAFSVFSEVNVLFAEFRYFGWRGRRYLVRQRGGVILMDFIFV